MKLICLNVSPNMCLFSDPSISWKTNGSRFTHRALLLCVPVILKLGVRMGCNYLSSSLFYILSNQCDHACTMNRDCPAAPPHGCIARIGNCFPRCPPPPPMLLPVAHQAHYPKSSSAHRWDHMLSSLPHGTGAAEEVLQNRSCIMSKKLIFKQPQVLMHINRHLFCNDGSVQGLLGTLCV